MGKVFIKAATHRLHFIVYTQRIQHINKCIFLESEYKMLAWWFGTFATISNQSSLDFARKKNNLIGNGNRFSAARGEIPCSIYKSSIRAILFYLNLYSELFLFDDYK